MYGSVQGAEGNLRPYRDPPISPVPDIAAYLPPSATVGSHFALAEPRRSMLRCPDHSRRAVGFPIPIPYPLSLI